MKIEMIPIEAVRADDLTAEQIRAFRIADNKLHELSSWNLDQLAIELTELKSLDFGLDVRCLPCAVGPGGAEKCWVTCVAVGGWGIPRLH